MKLLKKGLFLFAVGMTAFGITACKKEDGGNDTGGGTEEVPPAEDPNKEEIEELKRVSVNVKIPYSNAIINDFTLPEKYTSYDANFNAIDYKLQWTLANDEHIKQVGNQIQVTRPELGYAPVSKIANVRMFYPTDETIYYDFEIGFDIVPENVSAEDQVKYAAENILIPANLDYVVNDINLPKVVYFDSTEFLIEWSVDNTTNVKLGVYDVNEPKIEVIKADIVRPAIGQADVKATLTAKVGGKTYIPNAQGGNDVVVVNTTKTFDITIRAEKERITYDFEEDFEAYETGTYFSDIRSPYWEYIDETKRVKEAVVVSEITNQQGSQFNSLVQGSNALMLEPSTFKSESYNAYVSLGNNFIMESYVMAIDGGNEFDIEFRQEDSKLFDVGIDQNEFTIDGKASGHYLDDGVWYKIRMEFNNGVITYSYYDFETGNLVTIGTKDLGISASEIEFIRFAIPAMDEPGINYIDDFKICHELPVSAGVNPNRTDGLGVYKDYDGTVESEFDAYVVVNQGSTYQLPEIVVYNRFSGETKYTQGVEYEIVKTITNLKTNQVVNEIDYDTVANYSVKYEITLVKNAVAPAEKRVLERIVSVQEVGAKTELNNLSISIIRNGNLTIKGDFTRENNKLYYYVSDTKNENITANDVITNGAMIEIASNKLNTSISVGMGSIGKYIYFATVADNGTVGNVYKNMADDVEEALTDIVNIKTANQFVDMCINKDTEMDKFQLANDIDMTGYSWGKSMVAFSGTLDGRGFTVKNIKNESVEDVAGGLFYNVEGTIKNIRFENCVIIADAECGLFGKESNGGTFDNIELVNVTVIGDNTSNTSGYVGALVGRARTTGKTTTIKKVSLVNDADHYIKSSRYTGGLLGGVENATCNITNCYVKSKLIDERQCTGGIIGRAKAGAVVTASKCIIDAEIVSYKYAGFIIGENEYNNILGTTLSDIIISGTIKGGETNKKNFGLISGRLQGVYTSISGILALGARLTTNSIGEAIDNSQDQKVMTLDTGVFTNDPVLVAVNGVVGQRYMCRENVSLSDLTEAGFKQYLLKYDFTLDWENAWTWTEDGIAIKHNF